MACCIRKIDREKEVKEMKIQTNYGDGREYTTKTEEDYTSIIFITL